MQTINGKVSETASQITGIEFQEIIAIQITDTEIPDEDCWQVSIFIDGGHVLYTVLPKRVAQQFLKEWQASKVKH